MLSTAQTGKGAAQLENRTAEDPLPFSQRVFHVVCQR